MLHNAAAASDPEAVLQAGAAALQAGVHEEAAAAVEKVLRRHPRHPQLWHLMGLLQRHLKDLARSEEAFARAVSLAPRDPTIVHGHACARFEAGLPSARHFEQAMRLAPGDRAMALRHAAALIAEGQSETAVSRIDAELLRTPGWIQGHAALARVRWTRGDREGFADSIERALAGAPRTAALWQVYLDLLTQAGLHERTLAVVERARAAAGAQRGFDIAEAVARSELAQAPAAEALFRRLAPLRQAPLIAHYLRFLLRNGRYKEAAQVGESAAARDPSNEIWPYLSLAWRLLDDPRWEWLEGDPRFVGVYDVGSTLPSLDMLAERLRSLHASAHAPLGQSVRGGTQTEGHLFDRVDPEIRQLRDAAAEAVRAHVAQLPPPQAGHPLLLAKRDPICFAGSWSVRLTGGGRHSEHVHPAGWFSSALYIVLPGADERGSAESGWLSLGEATELGLGLPPIRLVEPKPGRLVLFPSTMWHGTRPFAGGERLTVAFDVKRPG
jgi:Tfp pilus assembly protein PilF